MICFSDFGSIKTQYGVGISMIIIKMSMFLTNMIIIFIDSFYRRRSYKYEEYLKAYYELMKDKTMQTDPEPIPYIEGDVYSLLPEHDPMMTPGVVSRWSLFDGDAEILGQINNHLVLENLQEEVAEPIKQEDKIMITIEDKSTQTTIPEKRTVFT